MAEHYRFTRDEAWLRHAAPGIVAGRDWIIRETARTANRNPNWNAASAGRQSRGYWRLVDLAFDQLLHLARPGLGRLGTGTDQASRRRPRA